MFDPISLALIGAAVGGLTHKKDPLTGALLGAGAGFTGGTLAAGGGLLGGAGAAAAEGAASGTTAATAGAASGGASANGSMYSLASGSGGLGLNASSSLGLQAPAGALTQSAPTGLLAQAKPYLQAAGEVGKAASAASSVKGLLAPQESMPTPQPMPNKPLDLSSVIGSNNQSISEQMQQDLQRKQLMSQFAQYAMGAR